ncbi:helicase domain-containing family protein [Dorcoceras hygrometricum]|uniref:Helicase domain-containing family protein n=1 Tax=Dorcoceras hygrometricum TaxID=472368 RepID=A0A2Z7DCQ4_9LAMI|nr:helicase domain-containing family protein [Dorcoceras hygrometricum]
MVVDLIGIYGLKGPYCTLTTTNWFLQALSVIPRGSWGDVARRSYHDPLGKSGIVIPEPQWFDRSYDEVTVIGMNRMFIRWTRARSAGPSLSLVYLIRLSLNHNMRYTLTLNQKLLAAPLPFSQAVAAAVLATPPPPPPLAGICSVQLFEENPSALISSGLLV